jgi:hypothetical protein
MNTKQNLLPFIILNVVISAVTTILVLVIYNAIAHPAVTSLPTQAAAPAQPAAVTETLPPLDQPVIEITGVLGTGDIKSEVVMLKRVGSGLLTLTGWKLSDNSGHVFTFPNFSFYEGAIRVNSGPGANSPIELFWGLSNPIWSSGSKVTLMDNQNNVRATYTVP